MRDELIKLAQKFKKIAKDKPMKQSKADKEKVRTRCQTRCASTELAHADRHTYRMKNM